MRTLICLILITATLFLAFSSCHLKNGSTHSQEDSISDTIFHNNRLSQLTDSIEKFPDSAKLFYERGALLFTTKDYENAKKDFKKAVNLEPLKSAYYTALGQLFRSQEFPDSAVINFAKALQINPKNLNARLQTAFILWQQNKYKETLQQTDTLLIQYPQLTQAMGIQSQVYEAMGDTGKALKIMKKVMNTGSASYDALMRMGDLLLAQSNNEALRYYQKAAQRDTTAAEPYYCMGLVYEKEGNTKNAITSYNKSIDKDAQFELTYLALGKLYEKTGDWEKAKKIFTLATRMSPTDSEAYFQRGMVNEKLKNKKAAIADYEQALVFNENNNKAQTALNRLKNTP